MDFARRSAKVGRRQFAEGAIGPLMQRLSNALEVVTGAMKCYVVFLAEAPGFQHVHLHVIPRLVDAPPERVGIGAMQYLAVPNSESVSHDEMDRISTKIREKMTHKQETKIGRAQ